jgi:Urb2/Npa2 family
MENASARKLTGLSSEQMNIFCLKKSVECATGFWNQMQRGEASLKLSTAESIALRDKCSFATSTFQNVLNSIDQQKDNETALPTFLSENIMTLYLRLALVFCANETNENGADNPHNEKLTADILSVAAACLKCIDSGDNFEKLVADFTDGAAFIFGILTKALGIISKSLSNIGYLLNIIRFGSMYINTLSSMSRKYSNRKKLYTTFCTRLLGQCLKVFEVIESSRQRRKLPIKTLPVLDDFILVLETLIEHSLFFEDKNIEDLAASAAAIEDFSRDAPILEGSSGAFYRSSSTFKASYHGGFFDALGATCLEVASIEKTVSKEESGCTGYPHGIAKLLQVYTKCSYRILAASILIEQNYDFRSSEAGPGSGGKPPSTLHERRKHSMRVLLISLALVAVVDTVYHKHLISIFGNDLEGTGSVTVRDEEIIRSVRSLISCLETHKEVLKRLSSSMDETGGSSILATHDSLQGIAQRLHSLCNRSLTGASSPLLSFLNPAMLNSLFTIAENRGVVSEILPPIMLEARSVELDCVEILASIDHRVITETASKSTTKSARSRTSDSQLPSLVLQAISSAGASSSFSFENLTGQRLLKSKEQLLLSVITLYDDLRRMDNFVSEVRSVCHGDVSVCTSLFKLLGSQRVQQRLSQAFAALPVSQSELVWGALSKHTSTDGSCAPSSLTDKKCQSLILRALVQATTQSSSAPTRHVVSTSPFDDTPQSCDEILQLSAQISLTTALPQGIIESMSTLFRESIATLHLLEVEMEVESEKKGTTDRADDNYAEYLFNIMSLLLQLGAAGIVLHRDKSTINSIGESIKEDSWLIFRRNAGASLGLRSVQMPMGSKGSGCELGCVSSAAVLLSLSAFIATCESLKLTVSESQVESDKNEGSLEMVTSAIITGAEVDSHVVDMIAASSGSSSSNIVEGSGSAAKRKRAVDAIDSLPSITPTDFLLLLARSVSVWRHLAIESSTVCALTVAHFKELSRSYDDPKPHQHGLLLKHACLCRLMQLVTVLDCPILVSGILLAVQHVVEDSHNELAGQAVEPPAQRTRGKGAKFVIQPINPVPRFSMSLLLNVSNGSLAPGVCVPVPVGDLLSAAAASVGPGSARCQHITACIAHHAAAVISKVLGSASNSNPSNEILSWSAFAASSNIGMISSSDEKHVALAATSSVLLLCLQNHPNSSNKRADSYSAGDLAVAEKERWSAVESQLKDILRPLLSSLRSFNDSPAHSHLQALAPVLLDYLLQSALDADRFVSITGSKEQSVHTVVHDVCAEITSVLGAKSPSPSESALRILVEIHRRVCSFYCSLPSEISSASSETAAEVREVAQTLLLTVIPKLQSIVQSSSETVFFDVCCFLAADSLRLYAKYSEDDKESGSESNSDEFLASVSVPALPSLINGMPIELNGWFLLTGTILLLQRRAGNLLSVRGSLFLIERIRQAVLLAATLPTALHGSSSTDEDTLTSLSICLQGLITSVPHALRGEVGKMLVILSQKCASSIGVVDTAASNDDTSVSVSCAVLSRYVVMGVDSLLTHGGHHTGDDDSESNSSLISARAVLESVAVSCTSSAQMLRQPEVVLSLISALRKGITTIQQQQQRGRRKVRRTGVRGEQQEGITPDNDPQEERTNKGREHTLSVWASCCFSILSKIVPRLLKGNGGIKGTESLDTESNGLSDRARVQISAHALNVLEQLFCCDSVGGSSLPLLGNSIGTLGALLTTSMRVILSASEATVDDKERVGPMDAVNITNALRVAGRALTAASSSKELNRHAHILSASVVDMLAQRPLTPSTRELLLPGLFALFDRCKQKQRLQMFATVSAPTRAVLSDLHGTYLRDFKFTGQ